MRKKIISLIFRNNRFKDYHYISEVMIGDVINTYVGAYVGNFFGMKQVCFLDISVVYFGWIFYGCKL